MQLNRVTKTRPHGPTDQPAWPLCIVRRSSFSSVGGLSPCIAMTMIVRLLAMSICVCPSLQTCRSEQRWLSTTCHAFRRLHLPVHYHVHRDTLIHIMHSISPLFCCCYMRTPKPFYLKKAACPPKNRRNRPMDKPKHTAIRCTLWRHDYCVSVNSEKMNCHLDCMKHYNTA